jgi:hypothetical protein
MEHHSGDSCFMVTDVVSVRSPRAGTNKFSGVASTAGSETATVMRLVSAVPGVDWLSETDAWPAAQPGRRPGLGFRVCS